MSSARTTISMPEAAYQRAVQRQHELGYASFSDYIQALLRQDAVQAGGHLREVCQPNLSAHQAAKDVVAAAVADVESLRVTSAPRPPAGKVKYKVPRRSKKTPHV